MIGIDLVEHKDIENKSIEFYKRVLSDAEFERFLTLKAKKRQIEYVASRFACKEAIFKAYKHLDIHLDFKDITIGNDSYGSPIVICHKMNMNVEVSLTHTDNYSSAVAILQAFAGDF